MEQKAGDLHKFTRSFIRVACNYLTTQLEELGTIVSPSEYLRDFINTLGNSAKITTEVTIGEQPSHTDFWSSDIVGNRELLENIKHLTKVFFDEIEERSGQSEFFYALEMQCWSSIVTKLTQRECSTAETAALMQFSITGPIIHFLSDLGGYKVSIYSNKGDGDTKISPLLYADQKGGKRGRVIYRGRDGTRSKDSKRLCIVDFETGVMEW